MRNAIIFLLCAGLIAGCSSSGGSPVAPSTSQLAAAPTNQRDNGKYRLWAEYGFYINATHDRVDVVPRRQGRFHLNALKFLESYCTDCLTLTGLHNNGDGTVDLGVRITHPFENHPEYTGFDVKGIIMFNGSQQIFTGNSYHDVHLPLYARLSWRELGDPQLMNADGYTPRWSQTWDSGSDLPIFNYWEGKYATGVPNADVNGYLDFHTTDTRHMFKVNESVERTYTIWLPEGQPVVAGYAVEACWEPPTVTPVTNPETDFPLTANQTEPYHLKWVVNNGQPMEAYSGCCQGWGNCDENRVEVKQWGGITINFSWQFSASIGCQPWLMPCEPAQEGTLSETEFVGTNVVPPGKHLILLVVCYYNGPPSLSTDLAYTTLEFELY